MNLRMWKTRRSSLTRRLNLPMWKRPCVCSRPGSLRIGGRCVAPTRAVAASKANWQQRQRKSKSQKGLLLLWGTTHKDTPVTCERPRLWCRTSWSPFCRITFKRYLTKLIKALRRISWVSKKLSCHCRRQRPKTFGVHGPELLNLLI